ncbi:MAG TPA: DEAD/DEAH box helicase, partial [Verrucomicrobiae bacterium]|nr:DEAD/DEAH box helicase [Verrucomicrobiae bacterium]
DEGTKVKAPDSLLGQAARRLNPRYRLIASATPVKNRIQDLFFLLWWIAGGHKNRHEGFPYNATGQASFARMYVTQARNRTLASQAAKRNGYYRAYVRPTAQVCNLPGLWKLVAPYLLRRRKDEIAGIVPKHDHRILVPMGEEQAQVYGELLRRQWSDCNGQPATFAKLQALRLAAVAPHAKTLSVRARSPQTPKLAGILDVVRQVIAAGDPIVVFSAFHAATDMIAAQLPGARTLDGRNTPKERARVAAEFAAGKFQILLAGDNSMGFGFNFAHCSHVVCTSPEWPLDISEQPPDRCHRLTSKRDVHVYSFICEGTIEAAVERLLREKRLSAQFFLDPEQEMRPEPGRLLALAAAEIERKQ